MTVVSPLMCAKYLNLLTRIVIHVCYRRDMGSGVSKTAEDAVMKIVDAIQKNDTTALKTTLDRVFNNIAALQEEHSSNIATLQKEHAALQKEHAALQSKVNALKPKKKTDSATVRLTVPSTVADPDVKDSGGRPTLGIKHMTEAGHEDRLDQIQKQAADKADVFDGTAYLAAGVCERG